MRRVLYDRTGEPGHYLTGAGVVFNLDNAPVGTVQDVQVLNRNGEVVAWFDGAFAWDASGVLAFVKGSVPRGGLVLPKTAPLRARLEPTPAPFHPLLRPAAPPPLTWRWSERTLADVLRAPRVALSGSFGPVSRSLELARTFLGGRHGPPARVAAARATGFYTRPLRAAFPARWPQAAAFRGLRARVQFGTCGVRQGQSRA